MKIKDGNIVNEETGEVLGEVKPKFQNWMYEDYIEEYKRSGTMWSLEPMTAQELSHTKIQELMSSGELLVAEEKFDGHRSLNFLTDRGNRLFSRRISKKTNWYSENTDQVPHIRDLYVNEEFYGTVLDNEALLPVEGCSCRSMQSVMGALPQKAIDNQLEVGFAYLQCFDILYYKGVNIQAMPYWRRKLYEFKVVKELNSEFIKFSKLYVTQEVYDALIELFATSKVYDEDILNYIHIVDDYFSLFSEFLSEGKEGLILKSVKAPYEQKRSKAFIKLKGHETYDVVIMGYEDAKKDVDPNERKTSMDEWQYWIDSKGNRYTSKEDAGASVNSILPTTKYYALGWIGAIKFGVYKDGKLIEVGQTSGFDEVTRELISKNKESFIGKVIEVEAQHIIDKEIGSLQHPRFVCWRQDKAPEMCTFEAHIRKYE